MQRKDKKRKKEKKTVAGFRPSLDFSIAEEESRESSHNAPKKKTESSSRSHKASMFKPTLSGFEEDKLITTFDPLPSTKSKNRGGRYGQVLEQKKQKQREEAEQRRKIKEAADLQREKLEETKKLISPQLEKNEEIKKEKDAIEMEEKSKRMTNQAKLFENAVNKREEISHKKFKSKQNAHQSRSIFTADHKPKTPSSLSKGRKPTIK